MSFSKLTRRQGDPEARSNSTKRFTIVYTQVLKYTNKRCNDCAQATVNTQTTQASTHVQPPFFITFLMISVAAKSSCEDSKRPQTLQQTNWNHWRQNRRNWRNRNNDPGRVAVLKASVSPLCTPLMKMGKNLGAGRVSWLKVATHKGK